MTDSENSVYRVSYDGFLQHIERDFPTQEKAIQWARKVGVYERCEIDKTQKAVQA